MSSFRFLIKLAIDNDRKFSGYKVTEISDTQGYGSRVGDPEFYEPFIGQSIDTQVDTLSGATVSSTAVVNGLKEVVKYHNENYLPRYALSKSFQNQILIIKLRQLDSSFQHLKDVGNTNFLQYQKDFFLD